jgi:GNAT superfamily N-acetyltransferase
LLSAAEDWAKRRGDRFITLSVFPQNRRALQLYEHVGYSTDVLRMLKPLEKRRPLPH